MSTEMEKSPKPIGQKELDRSAVVVLLGLKVRGRVGQTVSAAVVLLEMGVKNRVGQAVSAVAAANRRRTLLLGFWLLTKTKTMS